MFHGSIPAPMRSFVAESVNGWGIEEMFLDVLLEVWEANRTQLRNWWMGPEGELKHSPSQTVPVTSLFGMAVRADLGQAVAHEVDRQGEATDPQAALANLVGFKIPQTKK